MRLVVVSVCLTASLSSQTMDPQALLDQVRRRVNSTVQRAPRYTCVESVERFWYAARKPVRPGCEANLAPEMNEENLVRSDRLRLDVAVGAGQEIFSWHGQKSFQTEEIDELITAGPISSGNYFSFLSSIFLEGAAKVEYGGLRTAGGMQVAAFEYAVPIGDSHFETRTATGHEVMGYHGEFTVDPANGELEELEILSDDLPEDAAACSFSSKTTYETALLNGAPFQLPAKVQMDILSPTHGKTRTEMEYHSCHEFTSKSVLSFDIKTGSGSAGRPKVAQTLPAGLLLRIRIKTDVAPSKAWAGDAIEGELASDVVDGNVKLVAPRGTPVHGLLLDAALLRRPERSYVIALQFQEMSFGGDDYTLHLNSVQEPDAQSSRENEMRGKYQLSNPPIAGRVDGRFLFNDKHPKVKGLVTNWVTR